MLPYRRDLPGNGLIVVQWNDNTQENEQRAKEIAHACAEMTLEGEGYGNYNHASDVPTKGVTPVDKPKALFGKHYPRLQALKKKYDPDMIFNKWFTIVPEPEIQGNASGGMLSSQKASL